MITIIIDEICVSLTMVMSAKAELERQEHLLVNRLIGLRDRGDITQVDLQTIVCRAFDDADCPIRGM